jgi:hypothetical protein
VRVLICGSRGWHDPDPIHLVLAEVMGTSIARNEPLVVIHGDAQGADRLAGRLAKQQYGAEVIEEPADWNRYGKAAGPIRNQLMLDAYEPEVVYAFRSSGKSSGTDDMIRRAERAGLTVHVIEGALRE